MLEGRGRILKSGTSLMVRLPHDVVTDNAFPFKVLEYVRVRIENGKLIVEGKSLVEVRK